MVDDSASRPQGVLICANPFSGSGPNRRYVDDLVSALDRRGLEPRLVWSLEERRGALTDPGLADWCRCVVVAGGDGSIQAVLNELCPRGERLGAGTIALATLPMGNENLFAVYFGFDRDAERLAAAIDAHQTRPIDLGLMTGGGGAQDGTLFSLMAGIGLDADVVHRMDRWRKTQDGLKRVGRISYLPRVLVSLMRYRYPRLEVVADGQTYTGAHLFVFNLPDYGGGLRLAPKTCVEDDCRLDWVLFERGGFLAIAGYALAVLLGRHLKMKSVRHGQAISLEVASSQEAVIQLDGDPAGAVPASIGVVQVPGLELLIT